jgi:hypothetical protein
MLEVRERQAMEDRMNRFHPDRNTMQGARQTRLIGFFWAYLATLYLISILS